MSVRVAWPLAAFYGGSEEPAMANTLWLPACSVEFRAEWHTTRSRDAFLEEGCDTSKAFGKLKQ